MLPLLEKIFNLPWNERKKIERDEKYRELAMFVGNDQKFSSSLIRLVKEIYLSNMIRRTYQTEYPTGSGNGTIRK